MLPSYCQVVQCLDPLVFSFSGDSGWKRESWRVCLALSLCLLTCGAGVCDGPADNDPTKVRLVPPKGIDIPTDVRSELLTRAEAIDKKAATVADVNPIALSWVRVIPRAIRISIETEMFYSQRDIDAARNLLVEGERRAEALATGKSLQEILSPRETADGPMLAVGGFVSKIDQSIQPYGIVLPRGTTVSTAANDGQLRLDVWLHGRGEKVSEAAFLTQRLARVGEYAPEGTVVLHPYGRYSNAFKFAGEVDVLEAIEHVRKVLPVDPNRITIRGFSMGGAGCWQMAVHYPNLWAAANPGAGFSETRKFLDVFQGEKYDPDGFARDLLHWYDCPDWVNNLRNVPTVAYSGEIDRQKQAADVMAEAYRAEGMRLPHVIGPKTAHKIHAESKREIAKFMADAVEAREKRLTDPIDLTTYTLRYNTLRWLRINGLGQHWKQARVQGEKVGNVYTLQTQNVTALQISIAEVDQTSSITVALDAERFTITAPDRLNHRETVLSFRRSTESSWQMGPAPEGLAKRPGLQGPIDDAFMDAFVFVAPDAIDDPNVVDRWVADELQHATREWQRQMRGDVNVLSARQVSDDVIASNNLILFGTPRTNPLIRKVLGGLPVKWDSDWIQIGQHEADADLSALAAIYPNPLNQDKYVVLNSGFTYREYAYLNNARQIPMLPDWALLDVRGGATTQLPGKILAGGFFDEFWQVK